MCWNIISFVFKVIAASVSVSKLVSVLSLEDLYGSESKAHPQCWDKLGHRGSEMDQAG